MSLLALLLWILGSLFFLVIVSGIFVLWVLPRIKEWLKEKYSPTLKRCFLEIKEGNNWPAYYGKLIHDTPIAMTYEYEIKVGGKIETREVTIKNTEPVEWKEGCRSIVMESGGTIGHSPSTPADVDPFPEGLYNMHREAYIKTQYNTSVTANKGIDIKLVVIVGMFLVVIVAAVAMSGVFKKPPVNNIYTVNQTAQNTTPPATVITGEVVP